MKTVKDDGSVYLKGSNRSRSHWKSMGEGQRVEVNFQALTLVNALANPVAARPDIYSLWRACDMCQPKRNIHFFAWVRASRSSSHMCTKRCAASFGPPGQRRRSPLRRLFQRFARSCGVGMVCPQND